MARKSEDELETNPKEKQHVVLKTLEEMYWCHFLYKQTSYSPNLTITKMEEMATATFQSIALIKEEKENEEDEDGWEQKLKSSFVIRLEIYQEEKSRISFPHH